MRTGIDAETGKVLQGWDHCVQSIITILTTRIGRRVRRRDFGSVVKELQDENPDGRTLMLVYIAIAEAIRRWEPGFRLRGIAMTRAGADGRYSFELPGTFYPNGHLGDYSANESRSALIGLRSSADGGVRFVSV